MPRAKLSGQKQQQKRSEKEESAKVLRELSLCLDHNYVHNQIDREKWGIKVYSVRMYKHRMRSRVGSCYLREMWLRKLGESYEGRVYKVSISWQLFLISGSFLCPRLSPILISLHFPLFLSFVHIQVMVIIWCSSFLNLNILVRKTCLGPFDASNTE